MKYRTFTEALSTAPGSRTVPLALPTGMGRLSGEPSASGLGLYAGNGRSGPLMPARTLGRRQAQKTSKAQYLLLLCLLAVWLDPEGLPMPPSCAEAPGRNPSQQWRHLPAPQSNQPGAGRGARESQESVSRQGRGGVTFMNLISLPELGWGWGQEVPGDQSGKSVPWHVPALFLENSTSQ